MKILKFSIPMMVRIGDINYGNHVGHHIYYLYFQEVRIAYLKQFGFSEFDIGGHAVIMTSSDCKYKQELLLGDEINVKCGVSKLKSKGFNMDYEIAKDDNVCVSGSSTFLCLNYEEKKVVHLPREFIEAISKYEDFSER